MASDGAQRCSVRSPTATFCVKQHVCVSKEKIKFAKAAEHNFSTEIFRITKLNDRRPRALYELEDINSTLIDGQFYQKELTHLRITSQTPYNIDKILDKRVRGGIGEYIVRCRDYSRDFVS